MIDTYPLQNLLQQVTVIQKKYKEIASITGEDFNLFSIMRMETNEDWTHSAFITELLNSSGSHGQGNKFIKIFIDYVNEHLLHIEDGQESIAEFEQRTAKFKKRIGKINDEFTEGGEIDIFIEGANKCIIIENKIYARDQPKQLLRYYNYGRRKKQFWLFYLTLNGIKPDVWTTGSDVEVIKKIISISYKCHILAWLELCKKEVVDFPLIRESITQYIYLLKKLTNQSTNKKMGSEVVKTIISNSDSLSAAFDVKSTMDNVYDPLLEMLKQQLREKAEKIGIKRIEDYDWGTSTRIAKESYFYFYLPNTRYDTYIALCFDTKNCQDFSIGVFSDNENLKPETEQFKLLQNGIAKKLENLGKRDTDFEDKYLYVCYELYDNYLTVWNTYDIWIAIPNGQTASKLIELVNTVYENIKDLEL
ncbi:MAG TPA: PD-(D/E)XK nuclease family protein [Puia sp.]|nr:PD-(D/E)XK nuclease family protein [Puia sp.]